MTPRCPFMYQRSRERCHEDRLQRKVSTRALDEVMWPFPTLVSQLPLYATNLLYYNSIYTSFPFFAPKKMEASQSRQLEGIADKYTFTCPIPVSVPNILNTSLTSRPYFVTPPTSRSHMGLRIQLPVADLFSIVMKRHVTMPTWLWLAFLFLVIATRESEQYLHKYCKPYMSFSLAKIIFHR